MDEQDLAREILELKKSQQRLTIYCVVAILLALSGVLMGWESVRNTVFDTIDVQRINIKEPDGTIRLTISNRTLFPGVFIKNKEVKHPRPMAGMLFFNDEGTENGGLIFNGSLRNDGKPSSGLSLTFDRYQQDQQLQLLGVDEGGKHFAGLTFNDVVDGIERPVFSEEDTRLSEQGDYPITKRVFLGKSASKDSVLRLLDGHGKSRLELKVTPEGQAEIVFLDQKGNPSRTISGAR
ncbi:hypothetical protein [Microbulbifer hainanensis]|uniref:hypothetical protein n=1 Tax=Microbulbifer hainanensis TaxID=2735675 RepID=UPI001865C6B2|nr:hypothetical protein [Microbulbifer hainanensis]